MNVLIKERQKKFRVAGAVLMADAIGLLISRILASLFRNSLSDTMLDVAFSLITQVVFLLIVPYIIYRTTIARSFRSVLALSNVRKPNPYVMLLCIPLGICGLIVTIGVSSLWAALLSFFGYTRGSSSALPETFSAGLLVLNLFITGVLPGVCEEFSNRGGVLTILRGSFGEAQTIVLCGVIFGLFHQNITQVVYTAFFGALMATLVLKTKSIFPAMAVHFINNALSVYLDFAAAYSLPLGGFFNAINAMLTRSLLMTGLLWLLFIALTIALTYLIIRVARKGRAKKTESEGITIISAEGEDVEISPPLEDKVLYRPVLRDWAFYLGALAITALTTFSTFYWGL